jgi:hypothetical protein
VKTRTVLACGTVALSATTMLVPALAHAAPVKAKPVKGTFSYTDTTPDATITALGEAGKRSGFCVGTLPAAPVDVNKHTVKLSGRGTLVVTGHNTLDWAMEVRDSKNNLVAGSDGSLPQSAEGTTAIISKAGTYSIIYCNLTGAPTATANYKFTPRRH